MNERTARLIPAVVILALAVTVAGGALARDASRAVPSRLPDLTAPAAADEVIVHLKRSAVAWEEGSLERLLGGSVIARLEEIGAVRLRLPPGETPVEAVARLGRLPYVEFVEPNHLVRATLQPNDPLYSGQTHYLSLIQAPQAWQVTQGSASVVVAILDSGVDLDHPDLVGQVWVNVMESVNGADDDRNGCVDDIHGCNFVSHGNADPSCAPAGGPGSVADDNGHGTFVAGIIAARANNAIGITGAAPGVRVMPVKILDCLGGGTAADAAQGLLYAGRAGARVANISFGADAESITLARAIREAHLSYGMVIVAATGNNGTAGVSFPARLPEAIAVASSGTPHDTRARSPFSDWGPEVALAAPGLNIISTVPLAYCHTRWLCVQDGPYALASGTSFAAPLVSALAALIISHNPNTSPQAVLKIMQDTAERLPQGDTPGWAGAGRIQMRAALNQKRYFLGAPGVVRE